VSEELADLQARSFGCAGPVTAGAYPAADRLTGAQLAAYLDRRAFAVVGSARRDGRPHAVISAYIRRGTTFWLPAVEGSARERNVRAHPWLTLTVTEGDRGAHVVILVEGPAEVVPVAEVPEDVRAEVGDWAPVWLRMQCEPPPVLRLCGDAALLT
jgi:predicted pyridoxine 5'-phosphate oxidase superfamily flavin-nucleotide-binding protein